VSFILNVDTAVETASVCLAENDKPLATRQNANTKDSAAWLHLAISEILRQQGLELSSLDAIAISAGPGSYTGLRVGMAAAKGLCYALKVPLITINTLQMMAAAVKDQSAALLCPMIDARRMEVFAALFDNNLNEVAPSMNLVLDPESFKDVLDRSSVLFFGNGSNKFQSIVKHQQAIFAEVHSTAADMTHLSYRKYRNSDFGSLAYSEPFYGKDFHSIIPNS
jgi:tRNA threonylcarbamoyladenosine biosynthesis protein TsaB